jgi:hypothetical protein
MPMNPEFLFTTFVDTDWTVRSSNPCRGNKPFCSEKRLDRLWGPPSLLFIGCRVFFLGGGKVVRAWCDHSHTSSSEVKNEWIYTFASPIYLHCVDKELYFFTPEICFGWQIDCNECVNRFTSLRISTNRLQLMRQQIHVATYFDESIAINASTDSRRFVFRRIDYN